MKRFILIFALLAFSMTSCRFVYTNDWNSGGAIIVAGEGNDVTESYSIPQFDQISISCPADVEYFQSDDDPLIFVEAPEQLQSYLKFEVNGSTLEIKTDHIRIKGDADINVRVNSKALKSVSIAGTGDFSAEELTSDEFSISIAGSGDIEIGRIKCKEIAAAIAGSGDITLSGNADEAEFAIAGSGDIWLNHFTAGRLSTKVSGSGEIHY